MKTAIVTGATHGIGAAIATLLAKEQFALVICARNKQELEAMGKQLEALGSPKVVYYSVDLSQKEQTKDFAQNALKELGHVDILVNNAGVFSPGNLCDEPDGQLEYMIQTNLYSAYEITKIIAPHMIQRKSGHIFNMCSVASLKAYPMGGSYSISKYALLGFSDNLREELKPHQIKVTSICPGATNSRSWQGSGVAEDRIMPAEDVAKVIWNCAQMSYSTNIETVVMRPQLGDL